MNGRVYDYNLGRFLSVDPLIQAPTNSQSINPYSYIMNNPLAGIDPTGYLHTGCAASRIDHTCGHLPPHWGGNGRQIGGRQRGDTHNGARNGQTQSVSNLGSTTGNNTANALEVTLTADGYTCYGGACKEAAAGAAGVPGPDDTGATSTGPLGNSGNWEGEFKIRSLGLGKVGGSVAEFYLVSGTDYEGKQAVVFVRGESGSLGLGIPVSEISGRIVFTSPGATEVNPKVFEGMFTVDSMGIQIGPLSIGTTTVYLGDAVSTDIESSGLDAGISFGIYGESKVIFQYVFDKDAKVDVGNIIEAWKRSD